jgi:hypothetical protein
VPHLIATREKFSSSIGASEGGNGGGLYRILKLLQKFCAGKKIGRHLVRPSLVLKYSQVMLPNEGMVTP